MTSRTIRTATVLAAAGLALAGLVGAAGAQDLWTEKPAAKAIPDDEPIRYGDFKRLARNLSPSVVKIEVTQSMRGAMGRGQPDIGRGPFGFPFGFGPPRGRRMPEPQMQGLGSGFIIHPNGLILTNNHVVGDADEITIRLQDEREFKAELIGSDPQTDLALVKIDAKGLPAAPLGDSSRLEVGGWVVAIGSPVGLSHTVTAGIISALGRKEVQPDRRLKYSNFIQTDAPINPGNSGGPLINLAGEVIGINTAIFGHQSAGVGFAIPINMAKELIPSLQKHGKVKRSWIGISIADVDANLAESFHLPDTSGALVTGVQPGSPAEKAGIQEEDVIVTFAGKPIRRASELMWLASTAGIGKTVEVKVIRDAKTRRVSVHLDEFPENALAGPTGGVKRAPKGSPAGGLGVVVSAMPGELARELSLGRGAGVLVSQVDHGSPAMAAGIQQGDVIVRVGKEPVTGVAEFVRSMRRFKRGDIVRLRIYRGEGVVKYLAFRAP
jgi:serine protease Do